MTCEYHHTKMLKHAGQAYDCQGILATWLGQLALPCCACPLPNINLPRRWYNVPLERAWVQPLAMTSAWLTSCSWIYMLILAMNTNFWLKSKIWSMNQDPMLGPGWSYFVNNRPYTDLIKEYIHQDEVSSLSLKRSMFYRLTDFQINTCVGFLALLNMLMKKSKGLRVTGLAAVSCAWQQLFWALWIGDLQKGER